MKGFSLFVFLIISSCASHHDIDQKKDPIRFGMLSRQRQYTQCFLESDSYLGKNQKKIGALRVRFMIDETGKVQDEKIESTDFKDPNLHACILEQIRSIRFLARSNGQTVEVSQAINFTP